MNTRRLLWFAYVSGLLALLLQIYWGRSETSDALQEKATLLRHISRANTQLETAKNAMAAEAAASADARSSLTFEDRLVEPLRRKLAEIEARYAGIPRPPPITNPFATVPRPFSDPAYVALYQTWYRARLETDYNAFLGTLEVSPEMKQQILDLFLKRQLAYMDLNDVTGAAKWSPTNRPTPAQTKEVDQARTRLNEQYDGELRALVGDTIYGQIQDYGSTIALRRDLTTLAERLSYTAESLAPEQSAQLAALFRQSGFGSLFNMTGSKRDDFATKAGAFLTPTQLKALFELQDEHAAMRAIARQQK